MKNWLLAVLATSALLVGACSDDDSSGGGDDNPPECTFTPIAEVRSTLGDANIGEPTSDRSNPSVNVCAYPQAGVDSQVIIRYEVGSDSESFAITKKGFNDNGQPTTDVSGLGDEAISSALSTGDLTFTSVVARKGSHSVQIVSRASLDQIKTLTASILARF